MDKEYWFALYVRRHHEKKTAECLEKWGDTYFLPVQKVIRQWSDRKKKVDVLVIPMVIFIHTTEKRRIELLSLLPSVLGTLTDHVTRKPSIIRDKEMETFMFMLNSSENTVGFTDVSFAKGDVVEVVKGPLKGLEGELQTIEGKQMVVIRIKSLGAASVEIPLEYIVKKED